MYEVVHSQPDSHPLLARQHGDETEGRGYALKRKPAG